MDPLPPWTSQKSVAGLCRPDAGKATFDAHRFKMRLKFGRILNQKPSRFLQEIPEGLFAGGRSGNTPNLTSDALEEKAKSAFDEMFRIVSGDDIS